MATLGRWICIRPPMAQVVWGRGGGSWGGGGGRDALEGKRPQRRLKWPLDRRLEEVAKAVGGGYCRLQMPLKLALAVGGTVAGPWLGALEGEGAVQCIHGDGCDRECMGGSGMAAREWDAVRRVGGSLGNGV